MKKFFSLYLLLVCNTICIAQTIENPVFDRSDVPAFRVTKVEITKDTTFVFCSYFAEADSWANISKETYLRDVKTDKKYLLINSEGLPFSPDQKNFVYDERCEIKLCFKSIQNVSKIDLVENPAGRAFNVYGIDLNSQYEKTYNDTDPNRFSTMSSFYDSSGDSIKAIQYKKDEIEAVKFIYGIASEEYVSSLSLLCFLYDKYNFEKEKIELANIIEKDSKRIWQKNRIYAIHMRTVAQFYSNSGMYEKAIENYIESINTFESLDIIDNEYALALRFLSGDYSKLGDNKHSLKYLKQCIAVRRKLCEVSNYTDELINALLISDGNSNFLNERIEIVMNELSNLPSFVDSTSKIIAEIHKYIARLYNIEAKYDEAINHCDMALGILEQSTQDNIKEYCELLSLKCKFLLYNGQKKDALEVGLDAKQKMDSLHISSTPIIDLLQSLSNLFSQEYDYENAICLEKAASTIYEKDSDWVSFANTLQIIANYYKSSYDYENAERYIRKAIDGINRYKDANQYYSSEISRTGNSLISYNVVKKYYFTVKTGIYSMFASICAAKGNYPEAISAEKCSCSFSKELLSDEIYAVSLNNLSLYLESNGQTDEAIDCARQSMEISKKAGSNFVSAAQLNLSLLYLNKGEIENALEYANEATLSAERVNDFRFKYSVKGFLASCYLQAKNIHKADSCFSDLLDNLKEVIIDDLSKMNDLQKQRMWDNYKLHFLQYRKLVCDSQRSEEQIAKLFNYVLFSKSLMLDSEIPNKEKIVSYINITWKDIQKKLSDKELAIEFIATPEDSVYNTYYALVIDKTCKYPQLITLYHESDLNSKKRTSTNTVLDIVGNLIWKPILSQYPQIESIYFSPDGILHRLAIEYSNVDGFGEMMENYNIYRLSSTKDIVTQNKVSSINNAILYGGLDYDMLIKESNSNKEEKKYNLLRSINARGGFDPLLSTLEEVKEISWLLDHKHVSTTLYTGEDGTEDSFKSLSGKDINIMHLSTHGMYVGPMGVEQMKKENNLDFMELISNENNPVKEDKVLSHSFLVMSGGNKLSHRETIGNGESDGILTASEISHVDLGKVDMVVLSACETGLGDIEYEGVYGLQRGFKKAGANTILMSLDKVDDEATKLLMVEFYKNLMSGKSKHQSLKDAQKYLRQIDNGKYNKPEYWASFIMLDGLN